MRTETAYILREIVNSIPKTINVDEWIDNGDGTYTALTCNTSYAQELFDVSIDGKTYSIKSVEHNVSITLKGKLLPLVDSFDLYDIKFYHGKSMQINAELDGIVNAAGKTPMIYLVEIFDDRYFARDEMVEKASDLRLFFLTQADYNNWLTEEHYEKAIVPMRALCFNFIKALKDSKKIGNFAEYKLTNHAKFGIFILRKGAIKKIFDDNFSGVEMNIRVPILKDMTCEGFC